MSQTLKNWLVVFSVILAGNNALAAQEAQEQQAPTFEEAPVLLEKEDADEFGHIAMQRVLQTKQAVNIGTYYELLYETAKRIERTSGRADIDWSFVLLESDLLQAWSLPGGKIAVNTGLMRHLGDKQEVAALLAHQMAHVLLGHDLFVLNQNDVQTNVLSQKVSFEGNQWEELAEKTGALLARDMHVGSYSRMMESEADDLAGVLLLKAGFDPAAQIGLWQFMKYEKQLNPEYVQSHPSVDWRIEQMQGSLPCYYQVYKEVWGQLPAGLKSAGGSGNVQCPPIVTGVMGQIRGNDTESYADNDDDSEAYEEGYDEGYSNGRKSRRMAYDWRDFHGFSGIYYDHSFYSSHFFYDPYYISWNYGFSHYLSYRIVFGGHNYYRWSPAWYGWNYYTPYRPSYRINKKNRKHYRRHARFDQRPNYTARKRNTRRGSTVTYDRVAFRKNASDRNFGERRVARKQRLNEGGGAINTANERQRPRRVSRDGQVAPKSAITNKRLQGGSIQQRRGDVIDGQKPRIARTKAVRQNRAGERGGDAITQTNGDTTPKVNRRPSKKRNIQPSSSQRKRAIENARERVETTKPVRKQTRPNRKMRQQSSEADFERPKARNTQTVKPRAQNRTQNKTPVVQPKTKAYTPPKQKVYKAPKVKTPKANTPKTTPKVRTQPRKFNRRIDK